MTDSYDERRNWSEAKYIIGNLWPRWVPNEVEEREWRRAVGRFNPKLVEEALGRVYAERAGDIPKLPYVRKAIEQVRSERSVATQEQYQEPLAVRDARERKLIEQDRQRCIAKLSHIPWPEVSAARSAVVRRYGEWFSEVHTASDDVAQWSFNMLVLVLTKLGYSAMFDDDVLQRVSA